MGAYFMRWRVVRRRVSLRGSKKDYIKHKQQALALAQNRVEYFNKFCGFRVNKINIRNQKTRWGSCSKKGNLNFNYKIALLPEPLADYIIAHELCHLKEFNHSQKFWNLVAQTIPDYLELRKELRNIPIKHMKKFFNNFFSRKLKDRGETGQVEGRGRSDKLYATARRSFGLANRLEHIKNRGKQNNK